MRGKEDERRRSTNAPRASKAGQILCVTGAALGALGLIGWATGSVALVTVVPGQPPMMPNTALGLLLAGAAGALLHGDHVPAWRRAAVLVAAAVVLAIGVLTLAEYALRVDLGIDELLFRAPGTGPQPGRGSPPTALALALLALALLIFDPRPTALARVSEGLVLAAGLIGFSAALAQLFGAGSLYRLARAPVVGVAVPTAAGLLLVSVGLLLERAGVGVLRLTTSAGPTGTLLRRLVLVAVVAPAVLGVIVTRVLGPGFLHELPPGAAILSATMTAVSLILLAAAAIPFDRSQEALRRSQTRTRELVEHAPDGIFLADPDGRYTDVNGAGCRMLGWSREELVGRSITDLIPPGDVPRLAGPREGMLGDGTRVVQAELLRKDGSYLPVEISMSLLPDGRSQAFVRDVSVRRRLEEELRRAIQARDEVMGVVAHDLRNPLGTILLQVGMLRRGAERPSPRAVDAIERSARRMNHLIRDLLDVTSLEAGRLSVQRARVPAAELVSDAVEAQRALASGLELRPDVAPDVPDVWADRDRLMQVLENLIGNAIKFTEPGGWIVVGAAPHGGEVLFRVSDTGVGIGPEDLPHVFDRFWQAGRDPRGAGLGLPTVKGIVEVHGGRVGVESTPGHGSTFWFTIPAAPTLDEPGHEAAAPRA